MRTKKHTSPSEPRLEELKLKSSKSLRKNLIIWPKAIPSPAAGGILSNHEIEHEEVEHDEIHDASASHNVDPLPPSSFRLKDLFGGGRKKEEEPAAPPAAIPAEPKKVAHVSAYAPGDGLVEEETIDEEEYEFTSAEGSSQRRARL